MGSTLMQSDVFGTYDHSSTLPVGFLKTSADIQDIYSQDLQQHISSLFNWVMNAAQVRAYNALEILLYATMNIAFLHFPVHIAYNRRQLKQMDDEVLKDLSEKKDRTNHVHLIRYLKKHCLPFNLWIRQIIRIDLTATWEDFFYLILRVASLYRSSSDGARPGHNQWDSCKIL